MPKKMKAQIHCPVTGCLYSVGSERHFTEKRFLNQHIAKVHAEKKYSCAKCQKSFGLDWWRKHHEKTCGIEWKCDCGSKYSSRESLLTHARRTQHKLPDFIISNEKLKQNNAAPKLSENPIIFMINPVIQLVTKSKSNQAPNSTPRLILPKTSQSLSLSMPASVGFIDSAKSPSVTSPSCEQPSFNDASVLPSTQNFSSTNSIIDNATLNKTNTFQKSIAIQTDLESTNASSKVCQSQASQCTRRKPKSSKVKIESTHTQTAESAVVKIKRKRSRRKSVAITTEPAMLNDQVPNCENSLWPGFQDFVYQHGDNLAARLFKNSASTQTNVMNSNKVLCDSETLTDKDLFKFPWVNVKKLDKTKGLDNSNTQYSLLNNIATSDTLSILPQNDTLQDLNIFSDNLNNFTEIKTGAKDNNSNAPVEKGICDENSVFSVFGSSCDKTDDKVPQPPALLDIHTQTLASAVLDYNLLANMETQTTDEFAFSDLEFSDTETQTPWDDFPNIDDSPLQTDQLSIEIQTDFSSFATGLNLDSYDIFSSADMLPSYTNKESLGVNTETQTLDKFYFPQFTNSESQTLDVPDFVFDS